MLCLEKVALLYSFLCTTGFCLFSSKKQKSLIFCNQDLFFFLNKLSDEIFEKKTFLCITSVFSLFFKKQVFSLFVSLTLIFAFNR